MKNKTTDFIVEFGGVILLIAIILFLIIIGPIFTIAALNTLFALGIAYNIYTWFAVLWLQFLLFSKLSFKGK